jgi:hypothetical protein
MVGGTPSLFPYLAALFTLQECRAFMLKRRPKCRQKKITHDE